MLSLEKKTIHLSDVLAAKKRLVGKVMETPLKKSAWLQGLSGAEVFMKLENLQLSGSFKFRGALNCLSKAAEDDIHKIWTASAGNHGLGVAEAARYTGAEVTICIPTNASSLKRDRLRAYNVGLVQHGTDCEVTESYARRLAKEKKAIYVSPYNDPDVIAGQATIAVEMLSARPDLTAIVVSVGGGGLASGVAMAAKAINPKIRIIGVCAANSPVMLECVKAGRIAPVFQDTTIADGIAGNIEPDSITFPLVRELVDDWVAVEEQDISATIFDFLENEGMLVEGAAAVAVAAVSRKIAEFTPADKVGVVVCGGNIAGSLWHEICLAHLQKNRD